MFCSNEAYCRRGQALSVEIRKQGGFNNGAYCRRGALSQARGQALSVKIRKQGVLTMELIVGGGHQTKPEVERCL